MTQNGARQYPDRLLGGQVSAATTGSQPAVQQANDQYTALQILTMAQRTAEEHVATARREAEHIRGEARSAAAQIVAEAQAQAGSLREDAERILARARASADRMAREAEEMASQAEQDASGLLLDARGRSDEIVHEAQANAREIKHRAQQVYEDVVGGLSTKRETLQQQIEALERFEREYRARLTSFMQVQLRALWVDQPQSTADLDMREIPGPLPASYDSVEDVADIEPEE